MGGTRANRPGSDPLRHLREPEQTESSREVQVESCQIYCCVSNESNIPWYSVLENAEYHHSSSMTTKGVGHRKSQDGMCPWGSETLIWISTPAHLFLCFFVLCNRHWFNKAPGPDPWGLPIYPVLYMDFRVTQPDSVVSDPEKSGSVTRNRVPDREEQGKPSNDARRGRCHPLESVSGP
jgi:hypothetical protein